MGWPPAPITAAPRKNPVAPMGPLYYTQIGKLALQANKVSGKFDENVTNKIARRCVTACKRLLRRFLSVLAVWHVSADIGYTGKSKKLH